MKRIFFICTLLTISTLASAQIEIRPGHPRIFFNADTWPAIKERAYGENRAYLDQLLDEVNQMTDEPVAQNTGPIEVKDRSLPIAPVKEYVTRLDMYAAFYCHSYSDFIGCTNVCWSFWSLASAVGVALATRWLHSA